MHATLRPVSTNLRISNCHWSLRPDLFPYFGCSSVTSVELNLTSRRSVNFYSSFSLLPNAGEVAVWETQVPTTGIG